MRNLSSNRNVRVWPILLLSYLSLFISYVNGSGTSSVPATTHVEKNQPKLPVAPTKSISEWILKNEKGEFVPLSSLKKESEILVLIFVSSSCPITTLYWERFKGVWHNYRDQGCKMIFVGGNSDDTLTQLHEILKNRDMDLSVYWDEGHRLAKHLAIQHTPLAVVLGRNFQILYRGRIDDSWRDESHTKERYLDSAITAGLEDKKTSDHLDDPFLGSHMR